MGVDELHVVRVDVQLAVSDEQRAHQVARRGGHRAVRPTPTTLLPLVLLLLVLQVLLLLLLLQVLSRGRHRSGQRGFI